jgi:di/tricarboxylate transporter
MTVLLGSVLLEAVVRALGSSFGFTLPVSTPSNAIVYGSGLVPMTRMVRAGILLDLCGFALIWPALALACPLFGWTSRLRGAGRADGERGTRRL